MRKTRENAATQYIRAKKNAATLKIRAKKKNATRIIAIIVSVIITKL